MSRLPIPGQDDGNWGSILNDYLSQSLDSIGSIKSTSLTSAGAELTANKGQANGYAPLSNTSVVPPVNLGSGTANNTTFLAGDNTWQTISQVPSGVGDYLGLIGNSGTTITSSAINYPFSSTTASRGTSLSWSSGSPQVITVNVTGVYSVSVTIYWGDNSTSGGFDVAIFTNCAFRVEDSRPAYVNNTASVQHISATFYLQQSQNIIIDLAQTTNNATLAPAVWGLVTRVA